MEAASTRWSDHSRSSSTWGCYAPGRGSRLSKTASAGPQVGQEHVVRHSPTWPLPEGWGAPVPALAVNLAGFEQQQPRLAAQPD